MIAIAPDRLTRFTGDGRDEMSGGGIPLTDAFAAVLEALLDDSPLPFSRLHDVIRRALSMKETRILAVWGGWDQLSDDIIVQLVTAGLIRTFSLYDEGKKFYARLADDFVPGRRYVVIPGDDERDPVTVTAYDQRARDERNKTAGLVLKLGEWKAQVRKQGRLTPALERLLASVVSEMEGRNGEDSRPPKPDDEPDVHVRCTKCGQLFARTKQNFTLYWSRDGWYWRTAHWECELPDRTRRRQQELITAIRDYMDSHGGEVPTPDDVRELIPDRTLNSIALTWKRLHAHGVLPEIPRPPVISG